MEMVTVIQVGIWSEHGSELETCLLVNAFEKPLLGPRFTAFRRQHRDGELAHPAGKLTASAKRWGLSSGRR